MQGTEGLRITEVENFPESPARIEAEQGVLGPASGVVDIARRRDNVVVTGQHHRLFRCQQARRILAKPYHPGQLVRIFFAVDRIAVWQVDRGDSDPVSASIDPGLDIACLLVRLVAGQALDNILQGKAREDGDSVV